jgi:hypothetical protein
LFVAAVLKYAFIQTCDSYYGCVQEGFAGICFFDGYDGCLFAFKAEFSQTQPKPTSLIYVQNQDKQTAQWVTYDKVLSGPKEKNWAKSKEAKKLNTNSSILNRYRIFLCSNILIAIWRQ